MIAVICLQLWRENALNSRVKRRNASGSTHLTVIQLYSYHAFVKATIDIPDDLYRRLKARSALAGRSVRDVTIELYQHWLGETPATRPDQTPEQWLDDWERLGASLLQRRPEGPTASEILDADRNRLEPR